MSSNWQWLQINTFRALSSQGSSVKVRKNSKHSSAYFKHWATDTVSNTCKKQSNHFIYINTWGKLFGSSQAGNQRELTGRGSVCHWVVKRWKSVRAWGHADNNTRSSWSSADERHWHKQVLWWFIWGIQPWIYFARMHIYINIMKACHQWKQT